MRAPDSAPASELPKAAADWALFLDVDGTLLEIAATPSSVVVPPEVEPLLARLERALDGALALVSGRSLATLDRLFRPLHLAAAGQHGIERRDARGVVTRGPSGGEALELARRRCSSWERELPGVLIEDKGSTVAVHYRQAPECESEVARRVRDAMGDLENELELVAGKKVFEIRPRGAGKDVVIEAFMAEPPFRGRTPVFIGDDRTDEDGFRAVNRLGGHSVRVGDHGPSAARHRLPAIGAVHQWLAQVVADLESARDDGDREGRSP